MAIETDPRMVAYLRSEVGRLRSLYPMPWATINAILARLGEPLEGPEAIEKPKPPPPPPPPAPPPPPRPPEKPPPAPPRPPAPAPPTKPTVKPELIIERTAYPKWWKDEGTAPIQLAGPGSQFVITARGDYSLYIGAIVLTVSGETNITLGFGVFGPSGPMDLGGADEPRGLVIAMGNSPAPCGSGSFSVTSDGAGVSVNGFVTYFLWKK